MLEFKVQDINPGSVKGVTVNFICEADAYKENWFEWNASRLTATFGKNNIAGGVLRAWKHVPIFSEMEYHEDTEVFYFISGTAIMPFADIVNGEIDMNSIQVVRICPGTQIAINANKAHFVAVAETGEPVEIVVVAPVMEAPRISLTETVKGIL
ncbi:MAG: cupin domain-containing protein [Oscillospiraceae bacterium]|nr:cupin domain-containing protein [Oscillospiraceae bacterium]